MNLICTPKGYIGAIGSYAFLGAAIACLFLPTVGDRYGRHVVWQATITLTLPLFLLLNLSSHIGAIYVADFFLGMALIGRFACGFILLTESMPKKN